MTRVYVFLLTLATALAADLPVRQVVLYKSGVGYFERAGQLAPGESARLDFKAVEMDDVLKSLTVADNAGKVVALRYDAAERFRLSCPTSRSPLKIRNHSESFSISSKAPAST